MNRIIALDCIQPAVLEPFDKRLQTLSAQYDLIRVRQGRFSARLFDLLHTGLRTGLGPTLHLLEFKGVQIAVERFLTGGYIAAAQHDHCKMGPSNGTASGLLIHLVQRNLQSFGPQKIPDAILAVVPPGL